MKYKLIAGLAHNVSHSFMSGMNYFDGEHVYPEVYRLARENPGTIVTIHWIPAMDEAGVPLPPRVQKSVAAYREWLPGLIERHHLSPGILRSLRTEVFLAKNRQVYVRAVAVDDRGKEHIKYVAA